MDVKPKVNNLDKDSEFKSTDSNVSIHSQEEKNDRLPRTFDNKFDITIKIPQIEDNKNLIPEKTPIKTVIQGFAHCMLFTPTTAKPHQKISFPSDLNDIDETQQTFNLTREHIIEQYYITTSCGVFLIQMFRLLKMGIIILPIMSMIVSIFVHTKYIIDCSNFIAELWSRMLRIAENSHTAKLLGMLTISVIASILFLIVLHFVLKRLVKEKFINKRKLRMKFIKADIAMVLFHKNDLIEELQRLGFVGNQSNGVCLELNYNFRKKSFSDCYHLYLKYLILIQQYNTDRMGPYDIASERLASQFRIFSLFLLLVLGIPRKNDNQYFLMNQSIHYDRIYHFMIGALADAIEKSTKNHEKSRCGLSKLLKRNCTTSHYALMLTKLIKDEQDQRNAKNMYQRCFAESLLLQSVINKAETGSSFVKDDDNIIDMNIEKTMIVKN